MEFGRSARCFPSYRVPLEILGKKSEKRKKSASSKEVIDPDEPVPECPGMLGGSGMLGL